MNFKTTLAILLIIAAAIFCFTFLSEDSEARLCVWDGGDAGALASTAANWDTDTAPIAGDSILFDGLNATGDDACTWDLATDSFGTFTIGAGYSGTVTQSSDMYISGFTLSSGTFAGLNTAEIYCSGSFLKNGGTYTADKGIWYLSGDNNTFSSNAIIRPSSFYISGNYTFSGSQVSILGVMSNVSGKATLNTGFIWYVRSSFECPGEIIGAGKIHIGTRTNQNLDLSGVKCVLELNLAEATGSFTYTITDSFSPSTCSILSGHATYTLTVNLNGHSLTATTITVGTRGILDCGNGTITCSSLTSTSGTIIEDTATWVFNDGAVVTSTSGEKFYNVQMKGDCDFVSSVNVTNDLRFVDVPADYDDLDIYLDTVYSVTIHSPYSFGAEITAAAEYTYLPDVQISISQFYEDVDFSIYAYISSNLPVTYNITGTASSWLSYHEGRIVGMPPDIGNYTYTITVTHETGSTDIIMGNILVGNLDTAEYGFDIILGLIWFIILTLLMFWGYHKNVPLLQVICILMLIFSAITMLRIENFDSFNLLFVLVNSVMFILGMIRYARL